MSRFNVKASLKLIAAAVLSAAAATSAIAGVLDPEGMRPGWKGKADKEWNSEKQREWREDNRDNRNFTGRLDRMHGPDLTNRAPAESVKRTYLRESTGGITVVESNS